MLTVLAVVLLTVFSQTNGQSVNSNDIYVINFTTSCPEGARSPFNDGITFLHSFWYTKSQETFKNISQTYPSCAMAHWGVAMSIWHPLWQWPTASEMAVGLRAAQMAVEVASDPANTEIITRREKDYINAILQFYQDYTTTPVSERILRYTKSMEQIYYDYQQFDLEIQVFYPLALLVSSKVLPATGNSIWPNYLIQRKAAKILETVQIFYPLHSGALHYSIHAYDFPETAIQGLHAAKLYAKSAPSIPHALHMPSHIFGRLGLWKASVDSNIATMQACLVHLTPGTVDGEYIHAANVGTYAMLQLGRDDQVKDFVDVMVTWNMTAEEFAGRGLIYLRARYYVETEQYQLASTLTLEPPVPYWIAHPYSEVFKHSIRIYGLAMLKDSTNIPQNLDLLEVSWTNWLNSSEHSTWSKSYLAQVEESYKLGKVWAKWGTNLQSEAIQDMKDVISLQENVAASEVPIQVAREQVGWMLLQTKQIEESISYFQQSLKVYPRRYISLLGLARALRASGQFSAAQTYYYQLLCLCIGNPGSACIGKFQITCPTEEIAISNYNASMPPSSPCSSSSPSLLPSCARVGFTESVEFLGREGNSGGSGLAERSAEVQADSRIPVLTFFVVFFVIVIVVMSIYIFISRRNRVVERP